MKDFENYWGGSCRDFPGDFRLIMKLAVMGKSLCIWNKTVFGNQNLKLVGVEQALRSLEKLGDNWPPFESEKERIKFISSERWDISRGMEDIWRQKSRLNWCKLGEITTRFFNISASMRKARIKISQIEHEGRILITPKGIKDAVVDFYSNLFTKPTMPRISMGSLGFKKISLAVSDWLDRAPDQGLMDTILLSTKRLGIYSTKRFS
jgi:hypothetical protein